MDEHKKIHTFEQQESSEKVHPPLEMNAFSLKVQQTIERRSQNVSDSLVKSHECLALLNKTPTETEINVLVGLVKLIKSDFVGLVTTNNVSRRGREFVWSSAGKNELLSFPFLYNTKVQSVFKEMEAFLMVLRAKFNHLQVSKFNEILINNEIVGLSRDFSEANEKVKYWVKNYFSQTELAESSDLIYHSTTKIREWVKIIMGGKLRSLGSLRTDNPLHERNTDNLGTPKADNQELHQIYFNSLQGTEDTLPYAATRDMYQPRFNAEVFLEGAAKETNIDALSAMKEMESMQQLRSAGGDNRTRIEYGYDGSIGLFFRKRDVLSKRPFHQDDGIAVYSSDYLTDQSSYCSIDWRESGLFVCDKVTWATLEHLLLTEYKKNYLSNGLSEDEAISKASLNVLEISGYFLVLGVEEWGGRQTLGGAVRPSIKTDIDGEDRYVDVEVNKLEMELTELIRTDSHSARIEDLRGRISELWSYYNQKTEEMNRELEKKINTALDRKHPPQALSPSLPLPTEFAETGSDGEPRQIYKYSEV